MRSPLQEILRRVASQLYGNADYIDGRIANALDTIAEELDKDEARDVEDHEKVISNLEIK